MNFSDRLFGACREKASAVVVGIDPDPLLIPRSYFPDPFPDKGRREALASGVVKFATDVINAVRDVAVAIKPQLAHFERLGAPGMAAFEQVVRLGREAGLLVIADGKRNDIGSTAEMYAAAYLGAAPSPSEKPKDASGSFESQLARAESEGPKADALTVNPYLGWDGIQPFLARGSGGIFVLVKTSNPSSGEIQDLEVNSAQERVQGLLPEGALPADGGVTVADVVAASLERASAARSGALGYGPVGAVVGATYPAELKRLRELMPHVPILIPGFGAQGGTADDVALGFDSHGLGAVVNASRSILYAYRAGGTVSEASRRAAVEMRDALNVAIERRRGQ